MAKEDTKKAGAGAPPAAAKTKTVKVPALSVASGREGFRRAGRAWSKEATVVRLSDLSKEQIKQIRGEALLAVTEIDIDEEAA